MAKGDSGRAQNAIGYQNDQAQNVLNNNLQRTDALYGTFNGNFQNQYPANLMQQNELMNNYRSFLGGSTGAGQQGYGPSQGSQSGQQGGVTNQQQALQAALGQGLQGQAAVDWVQQNYPQFNTYGNGVMWQPSTGTYGMGQMGGYLSNDPTQGWKFNPTSGGGGGLQGGNNNTITGGLGTALGSYGDFAQTGGFTPQNIQDIRARDIAPTRAIYENAQNDLARQRELQGGYFPGYATAQDRLARQMSNQIGDINTNANASIAQMIQQGRLAGTQGLAGMGMQGLQNQLEAMRGMSGLYGTTPAIAALTGNQTLGANAQQLEGSQLQNQLGLGIIQNQINKSQIPGNFQQALGNIGSTLGLAGQVAGGLGGIPGISGGGYF